MNSEMKDFARNYLKTNLEKCTEGQINLFKRMYAKGRMDASPEEVVDMISDDKLDHAMDQVSRTVVKNKKANQEQQEGGE